MSNPNLPTSETDPDEIKAIMERQIALFVTGCLNQVEHVHANLTNDSFPIKVTQLLTLTSQHQYLSILRNVKLDVQENPDFEIEGFYPEIYETTSKTDSKNRSQLEIRIRWWPLPSSDEAIQEQ